MGSGGIKDAGTAGTELRQKRIGFMSGYCTSSTVKVVVTSLSSGNVTVRANGVDYVVTLSSVAGVFYAGSTTLTGLSAGTRYPITLTQGSVVEKDCATWTAPASGTDFRLYFASCDDPNAAGFATSDAYTGGGLWKQICDYALNQRSARRTYLIFYDDLFYVSRYNVTSNERSMSSSSNPQTTMLQADYAVAWANFFGLLSGTSNVLLHGQNVWRTMALRNMPCFPQWGDWEFQNDLGWDVDLNMDPRPALGDPAYVAGKAIWDLCIKPLQPPSIGSADTTANHWAMALGDVKIVAPDYITRSTGEYISDPGVSVTAMTAMFGVNQITDILTALDTGEAFKVLAMGVGDRYLCDPIAAYEFNSGQQHPIESHCLNEYQLLYTRDGTTPPSIMDNPKCNGSTGKLIAWHGDTHLAALYENRRAGYVDGAGTHLAENWDAWFIGSISGSQNFNLLFDAADEVSLNGGYGGTTKVWMQTDDDNVSGRRFGFSLYADVVGSATPKQFNCVIKDKAGTTKASRQYLI